MIDLIRWLLPLAKGWAIAGSARPFWSCGVLRNEDRCCRFCDPVMLALVS